MEFPSLDLVQALQGSLNDSEACNAASRWSDVKVLLYFGRRRYWLKLYGGKVIDMMEYFPMANPLGRDYMISAPLDIWRCLADGSRAQGYLRDTGDIAVDGDLMQANRLYESTHVMLAAIRELLKSR